MRNVVNRAHAAEHRETYAHKEGNAHLHLPWGKVISVMISVQTSKEVFTVIFIV